MIDDYELIDSGEGFKLERFGKFILSRPCSQALWRKNLPARRWENADASFDRLDGNRWHGRSNLPKEWVIKTSGIKFILGGTDFGHLGIFPEQRLQWKWINETIKNTPRKINLLNLFAYSGGSTMAAALAGAQACHLDASKGMVEWARRNAAENKLDNIRWIVDDAHKFMRREIRRGRKYDAIVLDPPTFGRGASGEMYKIEKDLSETLSLVKELLSEKPLFVLFSSHTPGLSPIVAENILSQIFPTASLESGEMLLEGSSFQCPSGIYCRVLFK
ncbi:MAG: class I SAM-dependent methyltransferase [Kiritimatiellae bacterium]|nr:class I SAM-dependent methyltransferase [Kiritimatiellia bacterium]